MPNQAWKTDWSEFVLAVAAGYDEGLTDEDVSLRFASQTVQWTGILAETLLEEDNPGARMSMPKVTAERSDGSRSEVDYLFLKLARSDQGNWQDIDVGSLIRFETQIRKMTGPFPGLQWSELDDRRAVLLIGTEESRLLEVLN